MIAAAPIEIRPGDLITQDPDESRVYRFNFDRENLPADVTIDDYTITADLQKPPFYGSVPVAFDWDSDQKTLSDRAVDARFFGGTLGAIYRCACTITTNENPAQTKVRSFFVLIQRG